MSDEVALVVGNKIRRRRRLLGLTQQALAKRCGVSFQQIQKYECAGSRLSVTMLWRLACALDVELGYFFVGLSREAPEDREIRAVEASTDLHAA